MSCRSNFFKVIHGKKIPIPCRECINCRLSTRMLWESRCRWESHTCLGTSAFVSLTFDEENYPRYLEKAYMQKHAKNIRYRLEKTPYSNFKYFSVSEYGERSGRPHIHYLAFGVPFDFDRLVRYSWLFGIVDVQPFAPGNCRYVLDYITVYAPTPSVKKLFELCDMTPPWRLMSNGIGWDYMFCYRKEIENGAFLHGQSLEMLPKYYRDKLGLPPLDPIIFYRERKKQASNLNMSLKQYDEYQVFKAYNFTKKNQNNLNPVPFLPYEVLPVRKSVDVDKYAKEINFYDN